MTDSTLRIGVVGVPGRWSTELLADAVAARTDRRLLVDMSEVVCALDTGKALFQGVNLCELDALIVKKVGDVYSPNLLDRVEILRHIEAAGVRIYSRPTSILRLIDRLACTVTLAGAAIPMPATVITEDFDGAMEAIERFGRAVLKPLYSTKARGMKLVVAGKRRAMEAELRAFIAEGNQILYVQQEVPFRDRDLGVVFLGGEYVGTYARVRGKNSWNTTIATGGRYAPAEPPQSTIDLAHRAQALFELDFTSVDIVETDSGPLVFEVSAFGGFRGLTEGLGIDAAGRYADHVIASTPRRVAR